MSTSESSEPLNQEWNARHWAGVEVRVTERHPGRGEIWTEMASSDITVTIRLDQRGGISEPRLRRDALPVPVRREVGFFNWIPEHQTIWCYAEDVESVRDLLLRFNRSTLEALLGKDGAPFEIGEPLLMIYDTRVARCAHALADVFFAGLEDDAIYAQSLTTALVIALLSAASGKAFFIPAGGLAVWQLRIVKEYLGQHLSSSTDLSHIAELVGLSQSRVVRGFKASTGIAPYNWVTRARIQKAKTLLATSKMPLSEIALEVGFADQSHFTKSFKRNVGMTPGGWRRTERR